MLRWHLEDAKNEDTYGLGQNFEKDEETFETASEVENSTDSQFDKAAAERLIKLNSYY